MSEISRDPMRQSLRALTHGVYVLSSHSDGRDEYVVVSLVMQCSVQPPRIAFAVTPNARILSAIRTAHGGILSVLDASQLSAVRRYGAPGGVKHVPSSAQRDDSGFPIPPEASFALSFRMAQELVVGDHIMCIADVMSARVVHGLPSIPADSESPTTAVTPFAAMILASTGFPYAG